MKTTNLAAILFVETVGFNDLIAVDERRAIAILQEWRRIADPLIAEHGGELVDATSEELLVIFSSAVSATQCMIHLELAVNARNAGVSPEARFSIRAGLHVGEIWRDEARVYGNGINVAARVKSEAGEGEVLASEDFYRQVSNKLDLPARELPQRNLKNIDRPLRLYLLGASAERPEDARSETPSEAVRDRVPLSGIEGHPHEPFHHRNHEPVETGLELSDKAEGPAAEPSAEPDARPDVRPYFPSPSPGSMRLSELGAGLGEKIAKEVEQAIKTGLVEVKRDPDQKSVRISMGTKNRRISRRKAMRSAIFDLVGSLAATGGFLWAWQRWGSFWFLAGAVLLGFLPAVSGLKKLLLAASNRKKGEE